MKNLNCNQIQIFTNLEIIGEEDKNNIYIYIYISIFLNLKKICNLEKLFLLYNNMI